MKREEALAAILKKEPDFLRVAPAIVNGRETYICPVCGNGSGEDGTGIAWDANGKEKDNHPHWKCFKCGLYADVAELWEKNGSYATRSEAFAGLYKHYGIELDESEPEKAAPMTKAESDYNPYNEAHTDRLRHDSAGYTEWASRNIEKSDYLQRRGISLETCKKLGVGYDPDRYFYKKDTGEWVHGPVVVFPIDKRRHTWRCADEKLIGDKLRGKGKFERKENRENDAPNSTQKTNHGYIFNHTALLSGKGPVYVVEGEIDALSIIEAGLDAVSIGGTGAVDDFLAYCHRKEVKRPLIFVMDNDDAGDDAAERLSEALEHEKEQKHPLRGCVMAMFDGCKDANDYLCRHGVSGMQEELGRIREIRAARHFQETSALAHIEGFLESSRTQTPAVPTGFTQLDCVLDGGLYRGLYVIGAISSLGKTAFVMQMADQIAKLGHDVYVFALEMGMHELMARSISRETANLGFMDSDKGKYKKALPKTSRGITDHKRFANYSEYELELISDAIDAYAKYAEHLYIQEGIGDISSADIRQRIEEHIEVTGVAPVVVIDYAQILAPWNERLTDKQNMDKNILELKRISRDLGLTVIAISSFNRESYKDKVSMASFKESGAIEYSSDVLIGLQLEGAGTKGFDVDQAKAANPRKVELKILKNRNGATGDSVKYDYYAKFNLFRETAFFNAS